MKTIITLLLAIILLNSCTSSENADLDIICPCYVSKVEAITIGYEVTVVGQFVTPLERISNTTQASFSFISPHPYQIGDKIE
jgi:hypothetical protein